MSSAEKAAITKAASEMTAELNAKNDEIRKLKLALRSEERKEAAVERSRKNRQKARETLQRKRRIARNGHAEKRRCKGLNMIGEPCKASPLIPDRWEGPEKITGLYCLYHEPTISDERRMAFQLTGRANSQVYKRVTPAELAHRIIQRSPQHFLQPYLKSLGLKLTEEGEIVQIGTGLKLHGFSRGGQVIRSRYPDLVGQVNVAEKLFDRVYGKARQAIDLASQNTTTIIQVDMTTDRVDKVAGVLASAGALPNGNGHVDVELDEADVEEINPPSEEHQSDLD